MSVAGMGWMGGAVWTGWTGVIRAGRVRGWWFTAIGLAAGIVVVAVVRAIVALGADSGSWWARVPALLSAAVVLPVVTTLILRGYPPLRAAAADLFPALSPLVLSALAPRPPVVTSA